MTALGMIEVRGYLGAVSVADTALKAANVTLNNAEVIRGGITVSYTHLTLPTNSLV